MMKKYILFFLMIIACSCNNDTFSDGIKLESKLAVEGWIEEGDVPQVILSSTIPVNDVIDSTNVLDHVIRSAKITVSDGETIEVLRVKNDDNRLPPFIYFGSEIIGEAGKKYSLKIEYLNRIVEATTSIPKISFVNHCRV